MTFKPPLPMQTKVIPKHPMKHGPDKPKTQSPCFAGTASRSSWLLLIVNLLAIAWELVLRMQGQAGTPQPVPMRGLAVSGLVVAIILVAIAGRQSPPLLPLSALAEERVETRLLDWFVWMRTLACATATILILLTVDVAALLPTDTLLPLVICVSILAAANIAFDFSLRRFPDKVDGQVWIEVSIDLVILTLMLHFSGGVENPMSLLFLFHVIIAGILFSKARCYLVALLAFLLFVLLVTAEMRGWVSHHTLQVFPHDHQDEVSHAAHHGLYVYSRILLQALLMLTTAYFITTIMGRLRAREAELIELAGKETDSRQRLEHVVDAAGVGLRLMNLELQPVWTNSRFHAWSSDQSDVTKNVETTLSDGISRTAEHERSSPDGHSQFYRTTTAAVPHADGSPHQVVVLVQDITTQKRSESELLFAEKLAAVGELAGNISHEINNPLAVLSTRLHLLISRHSADLPADVIHEMVKMTGMADRITTITRALLDYCHPGKSERKPVAIGTIVERAIAVMRARGTDAPIVIDSTVQPELPQLHASPAELEQVLVNILMNAQDASPAGSTVTIKACLLLEDSDQPFIRLTVEDSGTGIPEALRRRIFEPFFTTKKSGKGTGLGLPICHRIIAGHGGRLILCDNTAVGARFQIDLPTNKD